MDIPDKLHARLKKKAQREGRTLKDLIIQSVRTVVDEAVPARRRPPIIESARPGSLHLTNKKIYDLIDFP